MKPGFDSKSLVVLGAGFFHKYIRCLRTTHGLQRFLQRRLKVHHRDAADVRVHTLQLWNDDAFENKSPGGLQPAIEINGRQNRFQRIDQQRRFSAPAAFFFAAAQAQIVTQLQRLRHADQMTLADQVGAQFRKLTFAKMRESPEKFFTGYQRQDRVPEKLQLLVVLRLRTVFRQLQSLKLARLRTVSQRLTDQLGMLKVISQLSFQRGNFSCFHVR